MEEFDPAVESVVAVGQAAPELAGGSLADTGDGRAVASSEPPVAVLSADDVGGSGQVELLLGSEDVLADPEVVAKTDIVVDEAQTWAGKVQPVRATTQWRQAQRRTWIVRNGGRGRAAPFCVEVGDRVGQVLSGLPAEDAESIGAGQTRLQPA
ncbi:hypothetical protein [Streptomyces sp. AK02-01A]|uniref:hypothetical protein n=1 Tax=Streptomyces sp. AK02-01A TaxID=3028648 RepID=UPI0029B62FC2|nr:hypothetical protein [Streptomyces sp. AK02-01A]MDX3853295.1 hypothetical protein [Streptomyces sp. AK02-01A]